MAGKARSERISLTQDQRGGIYRRRIKMSWSQEDAARRAGFGKRVMQQIENESEPVRMEHLHGLAKAFGATIDELMNTVEVELPAAEVPPEVLGWAAKVLGFPATRIVIKGVAFGCICFGVSTMGAHGKDYLAHPSMYTARDMLVKDSPLLGFYVAGLLIGRLAGGNRYFASSRLAKLAYGATAIHAVYCLVLLGFYLYGLRFNAPLPPLQHR